MNPIPEADNPQPDEGQKLTRQLRESEERFRAVFENAGLGIAEVDPATHFLAVNDRWCQIVRRPREELLRMNVRDLTYPGDQAESDRVNSELIAGRVGQISYEKRYLRGDGGVVWVRATTSAVRTEAREFLRGLVLLEDITQRKQAEEVIEKATARLNGIISSAMDAVISMDSNQKIVLFNPAAEKMFGISESEAVGQSINRILPERFWEAHSHFIHEFGKTDVSSRKLGALGAVSGLRANGEEFPIEASISQSEVAGEKIFTVILRDITHRERTEEALRQSEEKLRLAIDAANLGTWDWDLVTNTLVWSDRCKEMFGLAFDTDMTYAAFLDALDPNDRVHAHDLVAKAIQDKTDYNAEFRTRCPDGSVHWINARGRAFYNDQGQPVRMSGTVHDITEIVLAREALARSRAELESLIEERTAKLRETIDDLEHFSYSITHDMRAPLRAMQSFSFLLQEECGNCLNSQAQDYLRRIEMAARRMDSLIQDSLDYNKVLRDELPLGVVDVVQLLHEIIESYPNLQRWMGKIKIEFDELKVLGNVAGLTQCFSNLLGNATKFVAPEIEPQVRIWAEVREEGDESEKSKSEEPQTVRIWIEDNGLGIPEEDREKIFQMFQRLHSDQEYSGTGIGLAIVRKAVQRMGGEVGVESEMGKGSRFWIELKKADETGGVG